MDENTTLNPAPESTTLTDPGASEQDSAVVDSGENETQETATTDLRNATNAGEEFNDAAELDATETGHTLGPQEATESVRTDADIQGGDVAQKAADEGSEAQEEAEGALLSDMSFSIDDDVESFDDGVEDMDSPVQLDLAAAAEAEAEAETDEEQLHASPRIAEQKRRNARSERAAETHEEIQANIRRATVWASLLQSRREKRIVSGTLITTRVVQDQRELYAIVLYGGIFRVMIPFSEFFTKNPIVDEIDTSTPRGLSVLYSRQRSLIEKLYGAPIPFIVRDLQSDNYGSYAVAASRKDALLLIAEQNFQPDETGMAVMMPNDLVSATVLSVGNHAIFVNVGGVDTRIPVGNLTFRYLPHELALAECYKVGTEIPVVIISAGKDNDGHYVCSVSGRRAELEQVKRSGYRLNPGESALGTITHVNMRDEQRSVSVHLVLEDLGYIPAIAATMAPNGFGKFPIPGDKVRVSYQHYNEETGMTYVRIHRVHELSHLPY